MDEESDTEELSTGSWRDRFARLRWRTAATMVIVFCLGLALGGYGLHVWTQQRQPPAPRLDVSLHQINSPIAPEARGDNSAAVGLQLHNSGDEQVSIDEVRVEIPGFEKAGGLDKPKKLGSDKSVEISYPLALDCDTHPTGPATVRVQAHTPGQAKKWITRHVPQSPIDSTSDQLSTTQADQCSGISDLQMETRKPSSRSDNVLTLRVRLTVPTQSSDNASVRVRLRHLQTMLYGGTQVSFHTAGNNQNQQIALPATGKLRIRVKHCGRFEYPMSLNAAVSTRSHKYDHIPLQYDPRAARDVLDYTIRRCG